MSAQLQTLPARQRDVLQSIAVDSASIKDTAAKFSMSEGAVRVALHRGLASASRQNYGTAGRAALARSGPGSEVASPFRPMA